MEAIDAGGGEIGMSREIENVLAALDGFRMCDQIDYAAYSQLFDLISELDVPDKAVPLDKLCEWLADNECDPPLCRGDLCKPRCVFDDDGGLEKCWKALLTEWMVGNDG